MSTQTSFLGLLLSGRHFVAGVGLCLLALSCGPESGKARADGGVNSPSNLSPATAPSCSVSISPGAGASTTLFTMNVQSNAQSCRWALDGVDKGAVTCSGALDGIVLPAGTHAVSVNATSGDKTTNCASNTVEVTGDAFGTPSCSVEISPGTGTAETPFVVSWSSDAETCTLFVDGVDHGSVGCNDSLTKKFTADGDHSAMLQVQGSAGAKSCDSNVVKVGTTPGATLPTCNVASSPTSGTTSTQFELFFESNADSCVYSVDGVDMGSVACTKILSGSTYTEGSHKVTMKATNSAGTSICESNPIVVTADTGGGPLPTCSISMSPNSGSTSSTYAATWSSDAATCTLELDGTNLGSVACSSTQNFTGQSVGTHTVKLRATNSAGGTRDCQASFAVSSPSPSRPTASISMSTLSGFKSTTFTATWTTSKATSCSLEYDGVDLGSVACNGSKSASGLEFGPHTVKLKASNSSGTTTATSEVFRVNPTCEINMPTTVGYLSSNTPLSVSWTSDAPACTYKFKGETKSVDCSGSANFKAADFGVGSFTVELRGDASTDSYESYNKCSKSFQVKP